MVAYCLIALDKTPGVFSVVFGEIICLLLAKCTISVTGAKAKEVCSNLNLCVILGSIIEGAVYNNLENCSKS